MTKFNVTYEVITEESAEHGDAAGRGYVSEDGSLRDAIEDLIGYGFEVIEASEYPVEDPRWITAYNTNRSGHTALCENRSLHFPDTMTAASKLRLCRLLGVHGA